MCVCKVRREKRGREIYVFCVYIHISRRPSCSQGTRQWPVLLLARPVPLVRLARPVLPVPLALLALPAQLVQLERPVLLEQLELELELLGQQPKSKGS